VTVLTTAAVVATDENEVDSQGNLCVAHNLNLEFLQVDGHDVQQMPSTNLAVPTNELARLQQTPEITKVTALLKVA